MSKQAGCAFAYTTTGIPHQLTQDDQYEGFNLPGDTEVITNLWYSDIHATHSVAYLTHLCRSIAHSREVYGDPDIFRPERFLNSELPDPEMSDPRNIIFGHGRR